MTSFEGFSTSDYADFGDSVPTVSQLPSLPIDQVLPKTDQKISENERSKSVTFSEPIEQLKVAEPIILNSTVNADDSKSKPDYINIICKFGQDNIILIMAIILVALAYYYKEYLS